MKRRDFILAATALVAMFPTASSAQTAEEDIVQMLRQAGYTDIRVSRTFLGRLRITAKGPKGKREIILNPSNGTILRDYTDRRRDDDEDREKPRGRDRDDDDDDDKEDDDKDDDKDNSGSGSDNSGSDSDDDDD